MRDYYGVLQSTNAGALVCGSEQCRGSTDHCRSAFQNINQCRWDHEVNDNTEDFGNGERTRLLPQVRMDRPPSRPNGRSDNSTITRYRVLTDVMIVIFGISAWIGVNGICVQLPLLVKVAPEGWSLPAYIVVVVQAANISPVLYALCRKYAPNLCTESTWISSLLLLGSVAMGILAFTYDTIAEVNGTEHSVALVVLTFINALVGCSSSVLFVPYLQHFKEVHLVSFFVGEGLSGLIASAVALVQGIGSNPDCPQAVSNTTQIDLTLDIMPKFSPRLYFLFLFIILALSTCAFWLLEYMPAIQHQKVPVQSELEPESKRLYDDLVHEKRNSNCGLTNGAKIKRTNCTPSELLTAKEREARLHSTATGYSAWSRAYLFVLIGFINLLGNGFLLGIQSYSCLPYGNLAYHLTATLSHLANPAACLIALYLTPMGPRGITYITGVAFVVASYVTWLAFSSPTPPLRDTTIGVVLVVTAWVLLTGLVMYAKLAITAIFRREPGVKDLYYLGVITQAGSASGALFTFVLINYSALLVSFTACSPPQ